jgi:hypothetical protein
MPPLIKTSKESARDDVWATQIHDAICTAEAISAAAEAKNLYRLIMPFVLPSGSSTGLLKPNRNFQSSASPAGRIYVNANGPFRSNPLGLRLTKLGFGIGGRGPATATAMPIRKRKAGTVLIGAP